MNGRQPLAVADGLRWLEHGAPGLDEIEDIRTVGPEFGPDWMNFEMAKWSARHAWITSLSFAIPCREATDAIMAAGRPILEIGAATGFWSALLRRSGANTVATDAWFDSRYAQPVGRYHPILQMTAVDAVRAHPGRDVLCVWPEYQRGWCAEAIDAMSAGTTLHLVGEGAGGCTGDDRLFEMLDERFTETACVSIPMAGAA